MISLIIYIIGVMTDSRKFPPNVRKLSLGLINDENSPDDFKTMTMAYWTIFIGHDLSHTAISGMSMSHQIY